MDITSAIAALELEDALSLVKESLPDYSSIDRIMASLYDLADVDSELARKVIESVLTAPVSMNGVWRLVLGDSYEEKVNTPEWYRKIILLVPTAGLIFDEGWPPGYSWSILQKYIHVCEDYVGYQQDGTNAHLLQAALIALHVTGSKGNKLPDYHDEIMFVGENIDRLHPLLPVIKQRRNVSIPFLKELLDGESASLTSGIL